MCTVPEELPPVSSGSTPSNSALSSAVFQLSRRKKRRCTTGLSVNMSAVNTCASVTLNGGSSSGAVLSPDSTLLRRLLAGADLASVRNHSVLVDSNFSFRRTSSMSTGSTCHRSSELDPDSAEPRPRRSTMFSQKSVMSISAGSRERKEEEQQSQRVKGSPEINPQCSSPPVSTQVGYRDLDKCPAFHDPEIRLNFYPSQTPGKTVPKFPIKSSKRWRFGNPTQLQSLSPPALPSDSQVALSEVSSMRPRAHTTSELDRVFNMFTDRLPSEGRQHLRDLCMPLCANSLRKTPTKRNPDGSVSGNSFDKAPDLSSPLSQLLESTPSYSRRSNTTTSVFPWTMSASLRRNRVSTSPEARIGLPLTAKDSLRNMPTTNPKKPSDLHVLDMCTTSTVVPANTVASILAVSSTLTSTQHMHIGQDEQPLNFGRNEGVRTPAIPLSLTTDDILQWSNSAASQTAALQQLFRLPDAGSFSTPSTSRPSVGADGIQAARLPIRLAAVNPLLLCRRVAEWLLVANAWTMQMCSVSAVPPNALLATAATYRYCRCSEAESQPPPIINPTLAMPKVEPGLSAVLHRIWPQLLLASMIRENFAFATTPIPPMELNMLLGRDAVTNGSANNSGADLNIARMGTASALRHLIEVGNSLLLDTQVLECVRKCIFAQHAFPTYYPIPYATAIDELRQCCHSCSGDASLFNSVILLMNEMQSISPEGIHCLFSIDKLSGLFGPEN